MNIVSTCLITCFLATAPSAENEYSTLSGQLANELLWIDSGGTKLLTGKRAKAKLLNLVDNLHNPTYSSHHQSKWKNNQSYQIIKVKDQSVAYRLFFYCSKNRAQQISVTKIKVDKIQH